MAALVRHNADAAAPQFAALTTTTRADAGEIERPYDALSRLDGGEHPRTARLLAAGRSKMAQKLLEEAGEVALEAVRRRPHAVIRESADLVYQLVVLWCGCGVIPDEVWAEMRQRAETRGIAEKLPKPKIAGLPAAANRADGRVR
jgi:phosphoribosyl-ATP pyrophosphohydrolase